MVNKIKLRFWRENKTLENSEILGGEQIAQEKKNNS